MNGRNRKFGRTVASLLVVVLALVLTSAGVGPRPLVAHGQDGELAAPEAAPYSYAFTYQGQLKNAGGPVNGTCDFTFSLYDDPSAGTLLGTRSVPNVMLVDGLFTARLDFGAAAHTGGARWLAISPRCPAGSGTYVPLTSRQELTAAPAALALALPFTAIGTHTGPLASITNRGTSGSASALSLSAAGGDGLYVGSTGSGADGLHVQSAGDDGVEVISAGGSGVRVESASKHGVDVAKAGWQGVYVGSTTYGGVLVDSVGRDGFRVNSAGWHGVRVESAAWDGLHVGSSGQDGVHVGSSGQDGVFVERAGYHGLYVDLATYNGVYVDDVGNDGVYVFSAGRDGISVNTAQDDGVYVESALDDGVYVDHAFDDGVYVRQSGNPSSTVEGSGKNGFEVDGAEGDGLFVGRADRDGVHVSSAGRYAGYFGGNILVTGNCIGCLVAVFGLNASDSALAPGDVVTIQGMAASALDAAPWLWKVMPARGAGAVVGVVSGRAEVDVAGESEKLRPGETGKRLVPRDGSAQPGEYLTIVVSGPMQVRAAAVAGAIQPGARLTAGADGQARALNTVVVDGVTLSESAPILGIALDEPDTQGLVWVLVNPQ